jgi:hypothetical protein
VNGGKVGDEGEESAERETARKAMRRWRVLRAMVRAVQLVKTGRRRCTVLQPRNHSQAYLGPQLATFRRTSAKISDPKVEIT